VAQQSIIPVILSGGSGQRLWPLSRELYPKQLINLVSDRSLLQETVSRLRGRLFTDPVVVCNDEHRFIVAEQLHEIGVDAPTIILEPRRRNTAPAAALAALVLERRNPDAIMLLAPSDHVIDDAKAFLAAVDAALPAALDGRLVTFGVTPDRPATGYGYIQKGKALAESAGCFAIGRFAEKPDAETATRYLAASDYLWNSGLFMFLAGRYLAALEELRPDMLSACRKAVAGGRDDLNFFRPDESAFEACPAQSIDYAVMEHTTAGAVVPVEMGWHDVGSWAALWEIGDKDANGNVRVGDVVADGVKNSYLRSDGPMLAAVGLEEVFIIATRDAVLAMSKKAVDRLKSIVKGLREGGRTEHASHPRVHRPWGWYETLETGAGYQVKHLMVRPGQGISLQAHKHRAEHWVVVAGQATVTRGDEIISLNENESTHLPAGTRHRLANETGEPLSVIEVQSGSYLGEDDIIRFEDQYGRE